MYKKSFFAITILSIAFIIASCGGNGKKDEQPFQTGNMENKTGGNGPRRHIIMQAQIALTRKCVPDTAESAFNAI